MNYKFEIKGKTFEVNKQILIGKEILEIADCTPTDDYQLLLMVDEKTYEPIQLGEEVDLSRPGKEKFIVKPIKDIKIFINDEKYEFKDSFLTPRDIVIRVEKEPNKYYLKQIIGHNTIDYKNDMDSPIQIKNGLRFITNLIGPAIVS